MGSTELRVLARAYRVPDDSSRNTGRWLRSTDSNLVSSVQSVSVDKTLESESVNVSSQLLLVGIRGVVSLSVAVWRQNIGYSEYVGKMRSLAVEG